MRLESSKKNLCRPFVRTPSLLADELFGDLAPPSRDALERLKRIRNFSKNARFYAEGEARRRVFVLLSGRARFFSGAVGGRIVAPREILGLTELLADEPYKTSAAAVTPCVCECFRGEDLLRFLRAEPEVCFRLVKMLNFNLLKTYQILRS